MTDFFIFYIAMGVVAQALNFRILRRRMEDLPAAIVVAFWPVIIPIVIIIALIVWTQNAHHGPQYWWRKP